MKCSVKRKKIGKCNQNAEFILEQIGFKAKVALCMHHFTEFQREVFISSQHMNQHTGILLPRK